jgi:hypothetical protein
MKNILIGINLKIDPILSYEFESMARRTWLSYPGHFLFFNSDILFLGQL